MAYSTTYRINSQGQTIIDHDVNANLDYTVDWTTWLAGYSDTIASFTVTAIGVTVGTTSQNGGQLTAEISGGVIGQTNSATWKITTAGGRIDERTIYFNVYQR